MDMMRNAWISVCAIAASSLMLADVASAQEPGDVVIVYPESIPEVVERTFFQNDPNFYVNRGVAEQLDFLLGVGLTGSGFVENEIAEDARALNALYRDLLEQQNLDSPPIRTADLTNPYNTSLLVDPIIEPEEYPAAPPYNPPIIRQTPTFRPSAPIPGLW